MQINKAARNKESDTVAETQNKHGSSIASLEYAHVNKSIIYISQRINKKHLSTCCPAAKHQKKQIYEKRLVDFFDGTQREITLAPAII